MVFLKNVIKNADVVLSAFFAMPQTVLKKSEKLELQTKKFCLFLAVNCKLENVNICLFHVHEKISQRSLNYNVNFLRILNYSILTFSLLKINVFQIFFPHKLHILTQL